MASIAGVAGYIGDGLRERLRAADLDPLSMFALGRGPWEVWLLLRRRWGRRATLVDLYELEAASRGIRPECLSTADRSRLRAAARPVCCPCRGRPLNPHYSPSSSAIASSCETAPGLPAATHS